MSVATISVSNVQIYPEKDTTRRTKAMARLVLGGQLQLNSLRLIEGINGLRVDFPESQNNGFQFKPVSSELETTITNAIIAKYHEVISRN